MRARRPRDYLRLSELAEATGLRITTLRRWEQRYGFPDGARSAGGRHQYSEHDVERVRLLGQLRESGMSMRDAVAALAPQRWLDTQAQWKRYGAPSPGDPVLATLRADVEDALTVLDEPRLWRLLEDARTQLRDEELILGVIIPVIRTTDDPDDPRHPERIQAYLFARVAMGVLSAMARPYRNAGAPTVWLANPEGEAHEVGTMSAMVLLAGQGLDVRYFGANVPLVTLLDNARLQRPDALVLGVHRSSVIGGQIGALQRLTEVTRVFVGGRGSWRAQTDGSTVRALSGDLLDSVAIIAEALGRP
ncbi:MAG: MerR family transcriptional regulator [Micrococcales bacterium]|nr:MerR family transcriptional regulator [Micrococcales bacterium]